MTFTLNCPCGATLLLAVNRRKDAPLVAKPSGWEIIGKGRTWTDDIAALCPACKNASAEINKIQNELAERH
jgi:hypothetical protein